MANIIIQAKESEEETILSTMSDLKGISIQQYKTDVGFRTLVEGVNENLYIIPKYQRNTIDVSNCTAKKQNRTQPQNNDSNVGFVPYHLTTQ